MSVKIGDGKPLTANVTSNNKLQLKFKTSQFVGEYFHYTGDLFLIYNFWTTRTADLCAQLISERPPRGGPSACAVTVRECPLLG